MSAGELPTREELRKTINLLRMLVVGERLTRETLGDINTTATTAEHLLAMQAATGEEIDSWDASDPAAEWSEAHAYHAGFKAGFRESERRLLPKWREQ